MIARYYLKQKKGFYVDIGAYHPKKISNTYHFYKQGWKGINIDGSKKSIELFNKMRPNDINLHCCVGNSSSENNSHVEFFLFERGELNTFKKETLPDILKYHNQIPVSIDKIPFKSMKSILSEYLPKECNIDLLSIDAEGADEEILLSNDWNKFRPKLIIVESHNTIYEFINSSMHSFLNKNDYTLGGYTRHSYIFHDLAYTEF
jgi:hypothetical protein